MKSVYSSSELTVKILTITNVHKINSTPFQESLVSILSCCTSASEVGEVVKLEGKQGMVIVKLLIEQILQYETELFVIVQKFMMNLQF